MGYNAGVNGIHNSSTDFVFISDDTSILWEAIGTKTTA
jgi:hypothetical protein